MGETTDDEAYTSSEEAVAKKNRAPVKKASKKGAPEKSRKASVAPAARKKTSTSASRKADSKPRKTSSTKSKKAATSRRAGKVSQKKVAENEPLVPGDARKHFKEGQKFITPPNGDGTRAFYESLLEENPRSPIAVKYCIEFGVLNGTRLRESLLFHTMLRDAGALKGVQGGLKPDFTSDSFYNKFEKLKNKFKEKEIVKAER